MFDDRAADDDLDALDGWVSEHRLDAAAAARRHERALLGQAAEDASIQGVLRDLGDRGSVVTVGTRASDRRRRGHIRAVGRDFAILNSSDGSPTEIIVATAAVDVVCVTSDDAVIGAHADQLDIGLAEVLPTVAADRPDVAITTLGGQVVRGSLRSSGNDVVCLRTEGEDRRAAYVPIGSIAELVVRP